jgi:hypothetical protein
MRPQLFHILATSAALPVALADVQFTSPAAGATVSSDTTITVKWTDSGKPPLSDFTTYTLSLNAGGNDQGTFVRSSALIDSAAGWPG